MTFVSVCEIIEGWYMIFKNKYMFSKNPRVTISG